MGQLHLFDLLPKVGIQETVTGMPLCMAVAHLMSSEVFQQQLTHLYGCSNAKLLLVEQQLVFILLFFKLKRGKILVLLVCQDGEEDSSASNILVLKIRGFH